MLFYCKSIYENKQIPLTYPNEFRCDNGSEFKSDVTKMLEKHNVKINRVTTKYKHTHTAFAESFNKELAKRLFKIQDAQELEDPELRSETWVKHLYTIVDELNNEKTAMIGMAPIKAIKKKEVKLVKNEQYPNEEELPLDGLYRYFYQPGEQHGDQKRRATDLNWSKNTYRLK